MARYSSELIVSLRHHYENTDQPQPKIAADHGISLRTLQRMVADGGWARRADRPPRALPLDIRLLQEVQTLAACEDAEAADLLANDNTPAAEAQPEREPLPVALDRIERLVGKELVAEEAARAHLGRAPRSRVDAEKTARTLANLTQTLGMVQQLRNRLSGLPFDDYDDLPPREPDELRRELARRIEAFIARENDREKEESEAAALNAEPEVANPSP